MHDFFYGWYLKCQSDTQTLAVIPAMHRAGHKCTCSVQVITDGNAWRVTFPADAFRRTGKNIFIGKNRFGEKGIRLAIDTPQLKIRGNLAFGPLRPLKYDIMGPFAFVPFMECRHSVWSMRHSVTGDMCVNGEKYSFRDAWGYWEGDRGRSFPKKYMWTQCSFPGGALMLSVADIPMAGFRFTGIIGVILWQGKEYRIATYLGARVVPTQSRQSQSKLWEIKKNAKPSCKSLSLQCRQPFSSRLWEIKKNAKPSCEALSPKCGQPSSSRLWEIKKNAKPSCKVLDQKCRQPSSSRLWEIKRNAKPSCESLNQQCGQPSSSRLWEIKKNAKPSCEALGQKCGQPSSSRLWEIKKNAKPSCESLDQKCNKIIRVIQGNLELDVRLLEVSGQPLRAPVKGDMVRTIHESASCRVFYRFRKKGRTLFAFETDRASLEFEL